MFDQDLQQKYGSSIRDGKTRVPSEAVWVEEKTQDWYLDWCKYVFSLYCANETHIGFNGRLPSGGKSIAELRAYARGRQGTARYRKLIDPKHDKKKPDGRTVSAVNVNWDNLMVFPKFRDVALSKIEEAGFEPNIVATDTLSAAEKNRQYFRDKFLADARTKSLVNASGVMPEGATPESMARDSSDVDALYRLGFYAHGVEAVMRDAVEFSLDLSKWAVISAQCNEDRFDIGCRATHVYRNSSGHIQVEYVDPATVIIPKSKYKDFRDVDFVATVEAMTARQLREKGEVSQEELREICNLYCGRSGNPGAIGMEGTGSLRIDWAKGSSSSMDGFRVNVMTLYFVACEATNYIAGIRQGVGHRIFDKVKTQSKLTDKDAAKGRAMVTHTIQKVYRCKWVVGSNYVFDFGEEDTVVRVGQPGSKQAMLPILFWGEDKPSMTERVIPYVDSIQLAWLKLQSLKASIPGGPRLAVDMRQVEQSIDVGGEVLTMQDILGMFSAQGILLYRSMNEYAIPGQTVPDGKPIEPIPSGIEHDFNLLVNDMLTGIAGIRDVTGVSEVADGSANPNDMLIGVMNGLDAASNNALKDAMRASEGCFCMTVDSIIRKYQVSVAHGDISIRHIPTSSTLVKFVSMNMDMFSREFHLTVKPGPTERDLQLLQQMVLQKQGAGELSSDGALMVLNMIRERDISKAQYFLSIFVAKSKAEANAHQLQVIAAQSEHQAKANAAIEAERAKTEAIVAEGQMRLEALKGENRMNEIGKQGDIQKEIISMKSQMGLVERNFDANLTP